MKTLCSFFIIFLISLVGLVSLNAQNIGASSIRTCGSPILPDSFETWLQPLIQSGTEGSRTVYTIPVIVHVIHNGEAIGTGSNLSQAQVNSQLQILNEDFRKLNADISSVPSAWTAVAADCEINFCFAVVDPSGNTLAEPGINRINRNSSGFSAPPYATSYVDGSIKPATIWNPNNYLNIWCLSLGSGLLGYATFPNPGSSGLGGLGAPYGSSTSDGVVILNTAFGNTGTAAAPYNKGRTVTHEIGHWVGLRHIWGDGSCANDFCNDTPTQQASNYGCPSFPNVTCSNSPNGDMFMNYMDYVNDACMFMFSNDQKARVQAIMLNSPMRNALTTSLKCNNPVSLDAGINSIVNPFGSICEATIVPSVIIKNYGATALTSANINYKIDNNSILIQSWTGSLASGQSVTVPLSAMAVAIGTHTFTSFTSNPNSSADGNSLNDQSVNSFVVNSVSAPATTGGIGCSSPSSVSLSATGGGTLDWYTAPTGGTPVNTGSTYLTPLLNTTTTYYVESQAAGTTGNVGPATTTVFGGGGLHNNTSTQYLTFDVLQTCVLKTALVNSGAGGTRNIVLWDSAGTQIQTVPVVFPNGIGTITLNISLTPGSYRIGGTGMNLWRNSTGGTYPFSLNGVIDITGSSAGATYFYYIYNWLVETSPCVSPRTPVTATIGGPAVNYSAVSYDTMCINKPPVLLTGGTPASGVYSGNGVNSGSFDPAISGAGSHTITYSYSDINNCTGTASQVIFVDPCISGIDFTDGMSRIAIYPNPAEGGFTLEIELLNDESVKIELMNSIGQTIFFESHNLVSGNNKLPLNLNEIAKGIYFVKVKTTSSVLTERIVFK
ncbi:MAG: T9SS type A sorting domain-containing protein [Bacteroidota bacterium]